MRMRVSLSAVILLLTGSSGPIGPPFGPGPETDSLFGILAIALFGYLLYRMASGSTPRGQRPLPFKFCKRDMHEAN
jgi:hypothetical protein